MKSDPLFTLIKSLTRTEKSNFKKDAVAFGGKNAKYLLLFEAMEKQKEFDKSALLKKLEDEKLSRNFSMAKSYLYEALLKSLHIHRKTHGYNSVLETLISQAQVLFRKGLFLDSNSIVKKAKQLAYKTDNFQAIIKLIGMQQKMHRRFPFDKNFASSQSLLNEKSKVLEIIVNDLSFEQFSADMMELGIQEQNGNQQSSQDIEDCYSDFVLKKNVSPKSNLARMQYLSSLRRYYNLSKNAHQSLEALKAIRSLLESNLHFAKRNDSQNLIFVYYSIGLRSVELEDYELTKDCLEKLEEQKPEYKALLDYQTENYLELSTLYIIQSRDFLLFDKLKEKFPSSFGLEPSNFLKKDGYLICYRLAHIFFIKESYDQSLTYLSILMQEDFRDKVKGLASDIHILYSLNHMALDNAYLVSTHLKKVKRKLENPGGDLEHKQLAVKLLSAYSKSPNQKEEILSQYISMSEQLTLKVGKPYHFVHLGKWLKQ